MGGFTPAVEAPGASAAGRAAEHLVAETDRHISAAIAVPAIFGMAIISRGRGRTSVIGRPGPIIIATPWRGDRRADGEARYAGADRRRGVTAMIVTAAVMAVISAVPLRLGRRRSRQCRRRERQCSGGSSDQRTHFK